MTTKVIADMKAPKTAHEVALEVEGLSVEIRTPGGTVRAVNNVGFVARSGETLALLGESGCGKSMTAQAIVVPPTGSVKMPSVWAIS